MSIDPYRYFRIEARELLEQLGQGALDLEKGGATAALIPPMLRLAHTLKGAARVVRQPRIAEDAHEIEDLLAAVRDADQATSLDRIARLLALVDQMGAQVAALTAPGADEPPRPAEDRPPEPVPAFRPELADLEAVLAGLAEAQTQLGPISASLARADRIRHLIDIIGQQLTRIRPRDDAPGQGAAADRIPALFDEVRTQVGALERGARAGVEQIERELADVGEIAARLRLAPASAMFPFLERAVRDVAQVLGKPVAFEAHGGDIRVDSSMLAIVQSALLQVMRNAVAHGIETNARVREAAGKPAQGLVTVTVSRRGSMLSFLCSDDGRGVDFDAVRAILQKKGVTPTDVEMRDADALLARLLKSGISTSGTVTDLAGRGIGLDVVREASARLGGEVTMHSESGKGTTVELVAPASIASFEALLVEAGGTTAAIPLEAVRRTLRLDVAGIVETEHGRTVVHDGRSMPLARLARILQPAAPVPATEPFLSAFVAESGGRAAVFSVDRVLGTGSVVTRPLPEAAPASAAVAGISLDATGRPRLVLDPAAAVNEAGRPDAGGPEVGSAKHAILVVDDSLTTRMLEQSILESAGYAVGLATSGEEGLEKARAGRFALFLVDVEMPGMDGFAFVEQARADPALRDIPSILITSRGSAADRQRGREAGAVDYVVKGEFDQVVLLDRIKELVQ